MRYPTECPVFANRLRKDKTRSDWSMLPDLIIGVDLVHFGGYEIEGVRPDNQDRVFYRACELSPLTDSARAMVAMVRRGGK